MRSLLFVPADSERKLSRAAESGADALILDLEDSVATAQKPAARALARGYLGRPRGAAKLIVRINPLAGEHALADLAAAVAGAPDAVMLPKCAGAADVRALDHYLSALEAREGLPQGRIGILPIATETAGALFALGSYAGSSPRLTALTWGAEDLAADLGAAANRRADGAYDDPYRLARSLCLLAAAAAGVAAIDTVTTDLRDRAALEAECAAAARAGFAGKLAIHPDQVAVINRAFTPDAEAVAWARRVVAAFASAATGVVSIDGKMVDRPHLRAAERILARAGGG